MSNSTKQPRPRRTGIFVKEDFHRRWKDYCYENGYKMGDRAQNILEDHLSNEFSNEYLCDTCIRENENQPEMQR